MPEARVDSLMEIVARNLNAWHPEGIAAFEDFKSFFDCTYDTIEKAPTYQHQPEFTGSDAIGSWVVWNIVGHAASRG